jgi:hypothetical protein
VAHPRSSGGGNSASAGGQASSGGASVSRAPANAGSSGARARGTRPSQGDAQPREFWRPGVSRPTYIIRSYSPWYGYGYYDPWLYGYGRWSRYPYGVGIGMFGYPYGFYDPYYDPYGYGYGYGGYAGSYGRRDDDDDDRAATGSIRVRANPRTARVYVDGALVGTVDDFDGFSDHLEIAPGTHQLEIRAEGYETYTTDISVRANRTITARAKLKELN